MTIKEDLEIYPVYLVLGGYLKKVELCDLENVLLPNFQRHHFVRQTIRKTSPRDYERWEKYQKIIIMPAQMNYDLETMGEKKFEEVYKIPKHVLVFNRDRWRTGFYESKFYETYYE